MKMLKRAAAAAVTAVMLVSQSAAFADFTDMPEGEIGDALQRAVENKLITGIDENTIAPDAPITRAQMATIITRAFGATEKADVSFPDVAKDAWYRDSVQQAVAMSAFEGDENGYFNPENNITFQETYTVLARVLYLIPFSEYYTDGSSQTFMAVSKNDLADFSDKDKVASWAEMYTASVVANGGWQGIDGMLKPTENITRGEFALVMDKLIKTYVDEPGTYSDLQDGLTIVRKGGVKITDFKSSKNLILSYGIGKDGCTVENAEISGAMMVVLGGADPDAVAENKAHIKASGSFFAIRVAAPDICLDITGVNPEGLHVHGESGSKILMPTIGMSK